MKIEKINNDKLKITLTVTDLHDKDIDIADLSLDTPKAHSFFDDILEKAFDEFGFEVNDSPVIIEASPISKDTLVIFISKVDRETVIDRLKAHTEKLEGTESGTEDKPAKKKTTRKKAKNEPIVYRSEGLMDIEEACSNLSGYFEGQSMLYKLRNIYYLVLGKNRVRGISSSIIESVLCEYISKVDATNLNIAYFEEHGEVIIKTRAVELLGGF